MSFPQAFKLSCSASHEVSALAGCGLAPCGEKRLPWLFFGMVFWTMLGFSTPSSAQYSEQEVKAALVLNFARFVTWPDSAFENGSSPLVIGVLGDNTLATQVEKVAKGQLAGNHPIVVQRFDSAASVKPSQILILGKNQNASLDGLLARAGANCLTISESDDFMRRGGTIRFYFSADNKVRFEINPRAVSRQHLKPSAAILRLARTASDGR
jgi:YfiR/HmsC-like